MVRAKKKRAGKLIICVIIAVACALSYKHILRFFYPLEYKEIIIKYSSEFNVNPNLVAAIIKQESKYNTRAVSRKGAAGLMQIMPDTGEWIAEKLGIYGYSEEMLYDPETNIMMGTWYLGYLSTEFNGNDDLVIASYNGGPGNVNKWLSNGEYSDDGVTLKKIPFSETEKYLKNVTRNLDAYTYLYELRDVSFN